MRRLDISDTAMNDLRSIVRYIADQSGRRMADAVYERVILHCERIAELPGTLGTARPDLAPDLRSTPHRNYVIYFRYTNETVEIVNVLDARRDALSHFESDDPEI